MVQGILRDLHERMYTKRMQTLEKKKKKISARLPRPQTCAPWTPQRINQKSDEIPFEIPQKISIDFSGVWIRLQTQNKS